MITREQGLTSTEAADRLARVGQNAVPQQRRVSPWRMLFAELTHLLAVLLWIAAALSVVAGMPALAIAIVTIVALNAVFAFAQEYRADRSAQRLRQLLPATARVVRDGTATAVPAVELVPGDLVLLSAGDRVAADLTVVRSASLSLDESLLTGESAAVPHEAGDLIRGGTFVVQGEAAAVVAATGAKTALADIGRLGESATRPPSPMAMELRRVVRVIAIIAAVVGVGLGGVSLLLGLGLQQAFVFAIGVSVALVPEGMLPTVTLSLARGAELMAAKHALVRRLDAVETLGATSFICTDKTGTLTENRMNVLEVVTAAGRVEIEGEGYGPTATLTGPADAVAAVPLVARTALRCVEGRVALRDGRWEASGDPMEAALHCLALRVGVEVEPEGRRHPFSADRLLSSSVDGDVVSVLGATEGVLARCRAVPPGLQGEIDELTGAGRRVLAVASRDARGVPAAELGHDLDFVGVIALEDPPRAGVREALERCRAADIRIAMITGDHPRTGAAIAREIGLLEPHGVVLDGAALPTTDAELADLVDHAGGVVVARATPADKLRIARALRSHGHVVAMTGDGVNDAPALREADVGVAMGASGSDVAREAADVVLLDDHFATIVAAIELGRATFKNIRRFLTYHLTDNVAELAPFVVWALTGSAVPLAIGVMQVIALDLGSDMLPALALGAEPARADVMQGRGRRSVVDRALLLRAFFLLGLTEAVVAMLSFVVVLSAGGWRWGQTPAPDALAIASGTAFAAIVFGQMATAFACRSTVRPVWGLDPRTNRLLLGAVAAQAVLLVAFLGIPFLASLLGGAWPSPTGWLLAGSAVPAVIVVDAVSKRIRRRRTNVPLLPIAHRDAEG
ncbi:MAG: cation-translocating P-type ATPase [Microbacterium sp.]|uniref:cation-translocating P-type ATPase n=1 Tax=Microbacterium sp. TaxID=51671 RepID=UPI003F820CDE